MNRKATHILHDQFSFNINNQHTYDLNDITSYSLDWTNQAYFDQLHIQNKKFKALLSEKKTTAVQYKLDSVVNLSSRQLTETELRVLALGFNFRPSLPDVPIKDYIVATETYIMSAKLDAADATLSY